MIRNNVTAKIGVGNQTLAEAHKELLEANTLEQYETLLGKYKNSPRITKYLDARIAEIKDAEAAQTAETATETQQVETTEEQTEETKE